jgi:peptidoglycan/xylan/chitin deacetylase (PgdA/CDA1 family)
MLLHHKVFNLAYAFTAPFVTIGKWLGFLSPNALRVIILHDVSELETDLNKLLKSLMKEWNIVTPEEYERMTNGSMKVKGKNLLLTFDDGLKSNLFLANSLLKELNIKAIFFVISDFVMMTNSSNISDFISENLLSDNNKLKIPKNWTNMDLNDLRMLIDAGHTIGYHTKTHVRLSNNLPTDLLQEEVHNGADILENLLNIKIKHFAYPYGSINSIDKRALKLSRERFKYVHTGIRGDNVEFSKGLVFRDAIAFQLENNKYNLFSESLIKAFLSGFGDSYYKNTRKKIKNWAGV